MATDPFVIEQVDTAGQTAAALLVDTERVQLIAEQRGQLVSAGSFTSTSDAQILASSARRLSFSISNDSDQVLFIGYGATAVTTSAYRVRIPPGGFYTDDGWSGEVRGILAGAIGSGQVRYSAEAV
jgi:hypothetical protein